mmetsp:Transcript_12526/g.38256  ORF Transcript_12526/g.38256 Transcript_12526/m.38256 type:complete len:208 (+) Transcript_12526:273-896(+)
MLLCNGREALCKVALVHPGVDDPARARHAGSESVRRGLQHALEDHRHAREYIDVAVHDHKWDPQALGRQLLAAARERRHPQPRLVHLVTRRYSPHLRDHLLVDVELEVERTCDRLVGQVVVRRANAAAGEHVVESVRHPRHRLADLLHHVGDDLHAPQVHPARKQKLCQVVGVGVLRLPREDLIADDQRRCRVPPGHRHFRRCRHHL